MDKAIVLQLIETNERLAKNNKKMIHLLRDHLSENEDTLDYLQQEYQALKDKQERSIQEESQFKYLRKKLTGK